MKIEELKNMKEGEVRNGYIKKGNRVKRVKKDIPTPLAPEKVHNKVKKEKSENPLEIRVVFLEKELIDIKSSKLFKIARFLRLV